MEHFNLAAAPLRIARVSLRVRDLSLVSAFYRQVMGLEVIEQGARRHALGTGDSALLDLVEDPASSPRNPRDAGLFHTAFLLPGREHLAHWLSHALAAGITLQGASDHIVSEAIYLADPEGNGIEVYADRPVSRWRGADGQIRMATEPLDGAGLIAAGKGGAWSGFPAGGVIGHVHLQVGDLAAGDSFYQGVLGFDIAARYPGASFFGSGGYHHQLAGNVWNSRRAGQRPQRASGLDQVEIVAREAALRGAILARAETAGIAIDVSAGTPVLRDPWGTAIRLSA